MRARGEMRWRTIGAAAGPKRPFVDDDLRASPHYGHDDEVGSVAAFHAHEGEVESCS